jgi:hypothetical protein
MKMSHKTETHKLKTFSFDSVLQAEVTYLIGYVGMASLVSVIVPGYLKVNKHNSIEKTFTHTNKALGNEF